MLYIVNVTSCANTFEIATGRAMLRTVYLLQLTVWILCMQLVRTVYLLQITASGAARSNETEVGATNQIPSFEEIDNVHKNSRAIVRPSSIGLRLQKTPSPLKPASISGVASPNPKQCRFCIPQRLRFHRQRRLLKLLLAPMLLLAVQMVSSL